MHRHIQSQGSVALIFVNSLFSICASSAFWCKVASSRTVVGAHSASLANKSAKNIAKSEYIVKLKGILW